MNITNSHFFGECPNTIIQCATDKIIVIKNDANIKVVGPITGQLPNSDHSITLFAITFSDSESNVPSLVKLIPEGFSDQLTQWLEKKGNGVHIDYGRAPELSLFVYGIISEPDEYINRLSGAIGDQLRNLLKHPFKKGYRTLGDFCADTPAHSFLSSCQIADDEYEQ